ncbi:MAG: type I methionyl aminopeptidase [Endomicrobium sp.]|jgi:methionyl aminopeptidase|nr:type I methionyl aminopeptidase [Endomicrobium sp.]
MNLEKENNIILQNKPSIKIKLKTQQEIDKMRTAGHATYKILQKIEKIITPGVTTKDIDIFTEKAIREYGMVPAFLGAPGMSTTFPASVCVSVNNEVVHGIPNSLHKLQFGDIVSIDIGVIFDGYYSDAARTYAVGSVSEEASKLIKITKLSLYNGISQIYSGTYLGNVSYAIQHTVESNGFSVVRNFVGHGIGKALHEEPKIPNFGRSGTGIKLLSGMVLSIEPMVNIGSHETYIADDNWTVLTKDGSLSAHFEHTVLVTEHGYEILTEI